MIKNVYPRRRRDMSLTDLVRSTPDLRRQKYRDESDPIGFLIEVTPKSLVIKGEEHEAYRLGLFC
jgi:hypothetical protein